MTTVLKRATSVTDATLYTCPAGKTAIVTFLSVTEYNNSTASYRVWITDHSDSDGVRYFVRSGSLTAYQAAPVTCKGLVLSEYDTLVVDTLSGGIHYILGLVEIT